MGRGYSGGSGAYRMAKTQTGLVSSQRVYEAGGTDFVKSPGASLQNEEVVYVSVSKLDKAWEAGGKTFYVPPGGGGGEIKGRREGFRQFQKNNPDKPIQMSRVTVTKEGTVGFQDGRHRFSVFRDSGKRVIPVTVSRGADAERLKRLAGAKGYN